jgi:dihydrodipicolinate synthase/N-acetylneuraminate lyase
MITRRDFSKFVLAAGGALLGSEPTPLLAHAGSPQPWHQASAAREPAPGRVRGFVGTPVTPFGPDGKIGTDLYQKVVDFLVRKGADILASPMHVGECLSMSMEERKSLMPLAVEAVHGRVPTFIHCSMPGTQDTIELAQAAQAAGAQGIVVVTPYFYHVLSEALVEHFVSVAKSIDISVIIYRNISVGELPLDVLKQVVTRCPNVIGMKDGGHQMPYFTNACRITSGLRPGFVVFDGLEDVSNTMPVGGAGCFSPISELAPELVKSLVVACQGGDYEKARPIQWKVTELERILGEFGGFAGFAAAKPARAYMGRPCGVPRMPLPKLDSETVHSLELAIEKSGVLVGEPRGWA